MNIAKKTLLNYAQQTACDANNRTAFTHDMATMR